jgi:hypothetical protein
MRAHGCREHDSLPVRFALVWTWKTHVEVDSFLMVSGAFYANDHHGHHSHIPTLPLL